MVRIGDGERGVGPNREEVEATLKSVFNDFEKTSKTLMEHAVKQFADYYNDGKVSKKGNIFDQVFASKLDNVQNVIKTHLGEAAQGIASLLSITKTNDADMLVSDAKQTKILDEDANSGLNPDKNASRLISDQNTTMDTAKTIEKILENLYMAFSKQSYEDILDTISQQLGGKSSKDKTPKSTALVVAGRLKDQTEEAYGKLRQEIQRSRDPYNMAAQANRRKNKSVETSNTIILPEKLGDTFGYKLQNAIAKAFGKGSLIQNTFSKLNLGTQVDKIMSATEDDIAKLRAERISKYGLSDNPMNIGDKTIIGRRKSLWGGRQENLFNNIKLTKGVDGVDVDAITKALQESIQKNMFSAQTGGGLGANMLIAGTGGIAAAFLPSLEKSRAEADAANQIMSDIRDKIQSILQDILTKETDLKGLEQRGDAVFNADGTLNEKASTNEAITAARQMEERKNSLRTALADTEAFNDALKSADGNAAKLFRHFSFLSPELRDENKIIKNITAGLDKNGKALKFHTRLGEILNYSFQLMARNIGQMFKNWMLQLSPINKIKQAFSSFANYNTKWQRTMNVIKYNMRTILRPFMEWLAQKLVNIIGFFDIISMKIQSAFGRMPISVFDQAAAASEKIHEELEAGANVSAGFDELHDIGGDNTGANDLLGDIYKPELSPEWQALAERIGNLFAKIIKGDLGFGEAMKEILGIAKDALSIIWKAIKGFVTKTVGPFIKNNWLKILGWMFAAFLACKLISVGGTLLAQAIFSGIGTLGKAIFGKLFGSGGVIGTQIVKSGTALGASFTGALGTALITGAGVVTMTVGNVMVHNGVKNLTEYWDTMSTGEKALRGLESAGGLAATTLGGALLGSVIPGIGTGIGAALGFLVGATNAFVTWGTTARDNIMSVKDATDQYQTSLENQRIAQDNYTQALAISAEAMDELQRIEQATGLSGAKLDEQVRNGTLTINDMTAAQKKVYAAYLQNEQITNDLIKIKEQLDEQNHQATLSSLEVELSNAKESKSYTTLKEKVTEAMNQGKIDVSEARTIYERAMADMSDDARKTFMEDIPDNVKEGLRPGRFQAVWRDFKDSFKHAMSDLKNWWHSLWNDDNNFSGGGRRRRRPEAAVAVVG